jgi:hypothetical protein
MLNTLTESQRADLKNRFGEISNSYTRIEAERELIREILNDIKENFEILPKISRKLAKIYHKRNLQEVVAENEELAETYNELFS